MTKLEQAARQALEALESAPVQYDFNSYPMLVMSPETIVTTLTALREALTEQAEQEPVAWLWKPSKPFPQYTVITDNKEYLKAAKEQEVEITPLYATPVRTKDLTDGEIEQLVEEKLDTWSSKNMMTDFAHAVIAADREKNK